MKRRLQHILRRGQKRSVFLGAVFAVVVVALGLVLIPQARAAKEDAAKADVPSAGAPGPQIEAGAVTADRPGKPGEVTPSRAGQTPRVPAKAELIPLPPREKALQEALGKKIPSLEFTDTPLRDVIDALAQTSGAMINVDPIVPQSSERLVSVKLKDVSLREALGFVLRLASSPEELANDDGLSFIILPAGIFVDNRSRLRMMDPYSRWDELERALLMPVTVDFESTPLREVAARLSELVGENVVVDPTWSESPVTLKLKDVPLKDALTLILSVAVPPVGSNPQALAQGTSSANVAAYVVTNGAIFITTQDRVNFMRQQDKAEKDRMAAWKRESEKLQEREQHLAQIEEALKRLAAEVEEKKQAAAAQSKEAEAADKAPKEGKAPPTVPGAAGPGATAPGATGSPTP